MRYINPEADYTLWKDKTGRYFLERPNEKCLMLLCFSETENMVGIDSIENIDPDVNWKRYFKK